MKDDYKNIFPETTYSTGGVGHSGLGGAKLGGGDI